MIDGPGDERTEAVVESGQAAELVLIGTDVTDVSDGLGAEPHAVVVTEVGDGEPDVLVGVIGLDLAEGGNLLVEGGKRGFMAVLHAAGSVEEDVVNVGLTHDEWGLEDEDDPTAGPLTVQ